jgi:hypothetical protein
MAVKTLGDVTLLALVLGLAVGCDGSHPLEVGDAGSAGPAGTAGQRSSNNVAGTGGSKGGVGGSGGTVALSCDMTHLITVTYTCTLAGVCHDGSASTAAGLSLQPIDWPRLVGTTPGGMTTGSPSICAEDPVYMNTPYIRKGSPIGAGLIEDKITGPACGPMGAQMPNLGIRISPGDMPCFIQWATQLANM